LSTLELADRVAGHGRRPAIIDVGTHQELIRRCGVYQHLHELQFRRSA